MSLTRSQWQDAIRAQKLLKSFDDNLQQYLEEAKNDKPEFSDNSSDSDDYEWIEKHEKLLEIRRQLVLVVKIPENIGLKKWEQSELERHKLFYNVKAELGAKSTPELIKHLKDDSYYDSSYSKK